MYKRVHHYPILEVVGIKSYDHLLCALLYNVITDTPTQSHTVAIIVTWLTFNSTASLGLFLMMNP